jgi:ABC-type amino acid transport substrate-binding protein
MAVAKGNTALLAELDAALAAAIEAGELRDAWHRWMPEIAYPEAELSR